MSWFRGLSILTLFFILCNVKRHGSLPFCPLRFYTLHPWDEVTSGRVDEPTKEWARCPSLKSELIMLGTRVDTKSCLETLVLVDPDTVRRFSWLGTNLALEPITFNVTTLWYVVPPHNELLRCGGACRLFRIQGKKEKVVGGRDSKTEARRLRCLLPLQPSALTP
eukprot:SAG11_NODE_141_length_14934_cov_4.821503_16_plen_165_part_00